MRSILFLSLILVGACAARVPGPEPVAAVAFGDLALESEAGRDALRGRVETAARAYCRAHGKELTPELIRTEKGFCLDTLRQALVAEMPDAVRRAYVR